MDDTDRELVFIVICAAIQVFILGMMAAIILIRCGLIVL